MNLEDLLKVYRIPVDYPVHLEYLRRGTTAWNTDNGVHAIVKVRNHIVHSTSAKRKELASLGKMAKLEAKHLGLQYLELTLLAIIGYIGAYSDRTKFNRILGQEQVVPWGRTS
jgi:hypothetical protein